MSIIQIYTMIRVYLALTKGEQILLQWKDIKPPRLTSLHKLRIYRYLDSENNVILYSETGPVEALRNLSLPPSLYSGLMEWKHELSAKKGVQATDPDMPIFPASEFSASNPDNSFLTYEQATDFENKILEELGFEEQLIVRLRDPIKTKDVDLADYKGDYFQRDFELRALQFGLDPGAIDAVLGRKSTYTYARHYVDYRDEFNQEIIALTIERIISEDLATSLPPVYSKSTLPTNDQFPVKGKRIVKQYIISLENDSTFSVSASNAYGVRIIIIISGKDALP